MRAGPGRRRLGRSVEAGSSTPGAHEAPAPAEPRRPGALGTVLIALAGLVGVLLLLVGLALLALHAFGPDDGFYTTDTASLESPGYAIVTDPIDLGPSAGFDVSDTGATVRIAVEGAGGKPAFVGIGPAAEVAAYLRGVGHTVLDDWEGGGLDDWGGEPVYEQVAGGRLRSAPGEQGFWAASSEGPGRQALDWEVEAGRWAVLVANADASRGVAVEAEAGLRIGWLVWVGVVFTAIGLVISGLCAWALYRRLRRRPARASAAPPGPG